ncbi:MAG: hypothetical protein M3122_00200 [Actinomycetota bacterium]|nr:hypothetical protein [Actinomycetota bacterium]
MLETWLRTVFSEIPVSRAVCLLARPRAMTSTPQARLRGEGGGFALLEGEEGRDGVTGVDGPYGAGEILEVQSLKRYPVAPGGGSFGNVRRSV